MGFYLSVLIMNYYYQYLCWNLLHNKIPSDHYITMHRRSGHMFAFSQWRPQQPDAGSAFEIWPTGQNKIKIIWTEVYERRKKRQMFETRPAVVRRVSVRCCWSVTGSVVRYRADQINVGSGNLPVIFYDMLWCRNTVFFPVVFSPCFSFPHDSLLSRLISLVVHSRRLQLFFLTTPWGDLSTQSNPAASFIYLGAASVHALMCVLYVCVYTRDRLI